MKKALFGFFLISLAVLVSCKDQLNLIEGYKETAVVIGILDQSETAHYIKVTRSFIGDGETSSLTIAQIPDSNYFNQVDITITEQLANGSAGRTFQLHDTIIENKNVNGVFYAPEQKVYVFYTSDSAPLLGDAKYTMNISIDNGRIKVSGETEMVDGITLSNNMAQPNGSLKFADDPGEYKTQQFQVTSTGNSYLFNAKMRFDYREYGIGLMDSTDKSVPMDIGEASVTPSGNSGYTFTVEGSNFYNNLKTAIPQSSSIEKRKYLGIEIKFTGGSKELSSYISVNEPSSNLAQNKPEYTNLTVTEGFDVIGIFASRYTVTVYKVATDPLFAQYQALDQKSRRELCIGPITGNLLFCSDHVQDGLPVSNPPSWYCGN